MTTEKWTLILRAGNQSLVTLDPKTMVYSVVVFVCLVGWFFYQFGIKIGLATSS